MSIYKNILRCIDFSEASITVAQIAREFAEAKDSKLTVLHIVTYVPPTYIGVELPAKLASEDYLKERAKEHLSDWIKSHGLSGCTEIVKTGSVRRVIKKVCKDVGSDLVILGAHGETGLTKLLGSVVGAVSQQVKCDVLIVRP